MRDPLQIIEEIRRLSNNVSSQQQVDDLWHQVEMLDAALTYDPRYSDYEKKCYQGIRRGITDIIVAYRDGHKSYSGSAGVELTALEGSIQRRTIGPDGWPLKK